jgi:hypothetical protein
MHEGDVMDRAFSRWNRLKLSRRTDGSEKCRQFPFPRRIYTLSFFKLNLNYFHMFLFYSAQYLMFSFAIFATIRTLIPDCGKFWQDGGTAAK